MCVYSSERNDQEQLYYIHSQKGLICFKYPKFNSVTDLITFHINTESDICHRPDRRSRNKALTKILRLKDSHTQSPVSYIMINSYSHENSINTNIIAKI